MSILNLLCKSSRRKLRARKNLTMATRAMETLENRRVLTAVSGFDFNTTVSGAMPSYLSSSITWDSTSGTLTLDGTFNDDTASVVRSVGKVNTYVATLNSVSKSISLPVHRSISEIIFTGYSGDDTFENNTSIDSDASGGPGNDILIGGTGSDRLDGDSGNDTIEGGNGTDYLYGGDGDDVMSGDGGTDYMYGQGDDDTMEGGDGDDRVYGSDGDDVMEGGDGDDRLYGHDGNDTIGGGDGEDIIVGYTGEDTIDGGDDSDNIDGGANADTIQGGAGADEIDGGDGADVISGGSGEDEIDGGAGADTIHGNGDADVIRGGDGADNLYGDGGQDELRGEAGNDGLFGGRGNDQLFGGGGGDRFLTQSGDTVNAVHDADAEIVFEDTTSETTWFEGSWINWNGGSWSEGEIELIDEALAALHDRTGNTTLLKRANGNTIKFYRVGTSSNPDIGGWNTGSKIYITENRMDDDGDGTPADADDADPIRQVVLHEIAHFWDNEHDDWSDWKDISGWEWNLIPDNALWPNSHWSHDGSSGFARDYGEYDPYEDFATMFAKVMMEDYGWTYSDSINGSSAGVAEKQTHINDFLDSL